jgi:hypothetical protein
VEKLWMNGAFPVDEPTNGFFFDEAPNKSQSIAIEDAFSYGASLVSRFGVHRIKARSKRQCFSHKK